MIMVDRKPGQKLINLQEFIIIKKNYIGISQIQFGEHKNCISHSLGSTLQEPNSISLMQTFIGRHQTSIRYESTLN